MNKEQACLLGKLRKIVPQHWDPIGIADEAEEYQIEDEYDAYLPEILSLIKNNALENDIFNVLWEIETSDIGLQGDRKNTECFAAKCKISFNQ